MGDCFASFLDEAAIEAKGTAPLKPALARVEKLKDKKALAKEIGSMLRIDVDPLNASHFHTANLFGLWVEQDLNNPSRATVYILQGGLGMPDRSYYLDPGDRMDQNRAKYKEYLTTLLKLAGVKDAEAKATRVFDLEKKIAEAHWSRQDSFEVTKCNNPWSRKDFTDKAPGIEWDAVLNAASLDKQQDFIAWQPSAITGLAKLVKSEPLAVWKDYLVARAIDRAAPFLPKAFADAHFAFYGTALRGTPKARDRWKRAIDVTNDVVGDAVGKAYVEKHFKPEYKAEIKAMVDQIVAAFGRRIEGLAWMSPETRAKAKAKLGTLRVGIAYPDAWRDDTGLEIVRGDPLGNFERAELFTMKQELAKVGKPVNRDAWCMEPQTVNAVNLPVRNALNFPAAIMEPPFYVADATPAVKFGAIGAIIGHEISHSFDDQGALFDATGKLQNWWTPEDMKHFEQSAAALVEQYNGYKPFPDASVNGKQTLSENIADLAGLAAAYDGWKATLGGHPAPMTADGFTGDQQFFISYAQSWQSKMREPALRQRLLTDGHAPGRYRSLTVRNMDAWYAAFEVKPAEGLFLAPEKRVRVW
jgi:predicted metalloendopeptidase